MRPEREANYEALMGVTSAFAAIAIFLRKRHGHVLRPSPKKDKSSKGAIGEKKKGTGGVAGGGEPATGILPSPPSMYVSPARMQVQLDFSTLPSTAICAYGRRMSETRETCRRHYA